MFGLFIKFDWCEICGFDVTLDDLRPRVLVVCSGRVPRAQMGFRPLTGKYDMAGSCWTGASRTCKSVGVSYWLLMWAGAVRCRTTDAESSCWCATVSAEYFVQLCSRGDHICSNVPLQLWWLALWIRLHMRIMFCTCGATDATKWSESARDL